MTKGEKCSLIPKKCDIIALLTDFGTRDHYVSALKGRILSIYAKAKIVDLSHDIPPQDIMGGALFLGALGREFPKGTLIMAIVDPGVGSSRAPMLGHDDHYYFIGPDNGIFSFISRSSENWRILKQGENISNTFHGRDIFAPAGANLLSGRDIGELTIKSIEPMQLTIPPYYLSTSGDHRIRKAPFLSQAMALSSIKEAEKANNPKGQQGESLGFNLAYKSKGKSPQSIFSGTIIYIDNFGNLITNIPVSALESWKNGVAIIKSPKGIDASYADYYCQRKPGEFALLKGSWGFMEIALIDGSAGEKLDNPINIPVEIHIFS